MGRKGNFISVILVMLVIILMGIVGMVGYTIYSEIVGEGTIQISFSDEFGFPIIEYKAPNKENPNKENPDFSGVTDSQEPIIPEITRYRYLYEQLDPNAQIIYNKLYENRENLKTGTYSVEFGNTFSSLLSEENGDAKLQKLYQSAIEALIYENPEIFYLNATNMYLNIEKITKITGVKYNVFINNGNKVSYLANGFFTKEDVEFAEEQIETVKENILVQTIGRTDYEKIKIVHDYLIDNTEYDETVLEDNIYNIYGTLVSKKCVCEGYARAFQYLMNEVGIKNVIVIGTGTNSQNETENHAWNYVSLNNTWYAVDVTWDDPILIGGGNLPESSRYRYFLKGSTTFDKNHVSLGKFTSGGQVFTYPTLSKDDYE